MQVTKPRHCIFSHLATLGFAMRWGGGGRENLAQKQKSQKIVFFICHFKNPAIVSSASSPN